MKYISNRFKKVKDFYLLFFYYPLIIRKPYRIRSVLSKAVLKRTKSLIIEKRCKLPKNIELGREVYIASNTFVGGTCTKIGAFSSIAQDVIISPNSHPTDLFSTSPYFYYKKRGFVPSNQYKGQLSDTIIDEDVWIGARAMVMQGVHVGVGAIIAAGAVVTKSVEPYSIVGGIPAKHIKFRFDSDKRDFLIKSQWWNLGDIELKEFYKFIDQE